jgi:apolipoprotein N-acyltransferase
VDLCRGSPVFIVRSHGLIFKALSHSFLNFDLYSQQVVISVPYLNGIMADRGPQARSVAITFIVLTWLAVTARCWVRIKMIKAFALDDWLAVATLLLLTAYASLIIAGVEYGVGRHVLELTTHNRVTAMKM